MIYKVTTNSAPIKNKPSSDSVILSRLSINTEIDVINVYKKWASFIYNEKECYISLMYIKPLPDINSPIESTISDNILSPPEVIEPTIDKSPLCTVTIHYLDSDSKLDIIPPVAYYNLKLGNYTYSSIYLFGYNIISEPIQTLILVEENPSQTIVFEYKKILGDITIKYIDSNDETEIISDTIYTNLDLSTYVFSAKPILGYISSDSCHEEISLDENNFSKSIIFYYEKILGEITVRYVDLITREEIADSNVFNNLMFDNYIYIAKEIDGYTTVDKTSKTVIIDETLTRCEIYFEYTVSKDN